MPRRGETATIDQRVRQTIQAMEAMYGNEAKIEVLHFFGRRAVVIAAIYKLEDETGAYFADVKLATVVDEGILATTGEMRFRGEQTPPYTVTLTNLETGERAIIKLIEVQDPKTKQVVDYRLAREIVP